MSLIEAAFSSCYIVYLLIGFILFMKLVILTENENSKQIDFFVKPKKLATPFFDWTKEFYFCAHLCDS